MKIWAFSLTVLLLAGTIPARGQSVSPTRLNEAVRVLSILCVSGGLVRTWRVEKGGSITLESDKGNFSIEGTEAFGLVDGITNSISRLAADQANRARACMQPYLEAVLSAVIPEAKEKLLDPPSLQLGASLDQFKILTAGRGAFTQDRSEMNFTTEGTLLGMPGEINYGFGPDKALSSAVVWNRCIREKYVFPPGKDVDSSWTEWRTIKWRQMGIDLDCQVLLSVPERLKARYGRPINVEQPGDCASLMRRADACPAAIAGNEGLGSECKEVGTFARCSREVYLAKDRMTPISFDMRTYHIRALHDNGSYEFNRYREYRVGILGIGVRGVGPRTLEIDRGFTAFKYLQ